MDLILTPKVENVKLLDKFNPRSSPMGTLYLTTTHLIFVSNGLDEGREDQIKKELWMLHMLMSNIEKPLLTTSGTQLKIFCSHFQTATFIIQRDRDAHDVFCSIVALSRPKEAGNLYCFSYNPKGELRQSTGWQFHDQQAEFQRQVRICHKSKAISYAICIYHPYFPGCPQ
jgi:myotubularin-related protein 6/7/8